MFRGGRSPPLSSIVARLRPSSSPPRRVPLRSGGPACFTRRASVRPGGKGARRFRLGPPGPRCARRVSRVLFADRRLADRSLLLLLLFFHPRSLMLQMSIMFHLSSQQSLQLLLFLLQYTFCQRRVKQTTLTLDNSHRTEKLSSNQHRH